MLLNVYVPFKHDYGTGFKLEQKEIIAIKCNRYENAGTARIFYYGKDLEGNWYELKKKDNKGIKLPTKKEFQWKQQLIDVRGIRGVYQYNSNEINF